MPFGIRCASDVLQRHNNEIFGNIAGLHCSADDILIAVDSDEEHDRIFSEMKRAMLQNIRFNPEKSSTRYRQEIPWTHPEQGMQALQ